MHASKNLLLFLLLSKPQKPREAFQNGGMSVSILVETRLLRGMRTKFRSRAISNFIRGTPSRSVKPRDYLFSRLPRAQPAICSRFYAPGEELALVSLSSLGSTAKGRFSFERITASSSLEGNWKYFSSMLYFWEAVLGRRAQEKVK